MRATRPRCVTFHVIGAFSSRMCVTPGLVLVVKLVVLDLKPVKTCSMTAFVRAHLDHSQKDIAD